MVWMFLSQYVCCCMEVFYISCTCQWIPVFMSMCLCCLHQGLLTLSMFNVPEKVQVLCFSVYMVDIWAFKLLHTFGNDMSFLLSFMRPLSECILVSPFKRKVKVEPFKLFYHFSLFIMQLHEGIVCMLPFLINSTLLSGHIVLGIQWVIL